MASYRIWGDQKRRIVILDSSAILMPFEFSIDLEDELSRLFGKCNIVVPSSIVKEIKFLSKNGKGKKKNLSKPALKFIKKFEVIEVDDTLNADESVLHLARQIGGTVVTNDKKLKDQLKKSSIDVVFLRGKKRLALN